MDRPNIERLGFLQLPNIAAYHGSDGHLAELTPFLQKCHKQQEKAAHRNNMKNADIVQYRKMAYEAYKPEMLFRVY